MRFQLDGWFEMKPILEPSHTLKEPTQGSPVTTGQLWAPWDGGQSLGLN